VADAGAGRHDAEIVEGFLAPAEEAVALPLRSYSMSTFFAEAFGVPNSSTITEWSITRSTGTSGLILRGSPPSLSHGVAHGGEVDHGRNAGEVLHQDAGRAEGDFVLVLAACCRARRPWPRGRRLGDVRPSS
jgi:hypothetical protein